MSTLTADTLRTFSFTTSLHGYLDRGGSFTSYRCLEYPAFTKTRTRPTSRDQFVEVLFVGEVECPALEDVALALNALAAEARMPARRAVSVLEATEGA